MHLRGSDRSKLLTHLTQILVGRVRGQTANVEVRRAQRGRVLQRRAIASDPRSVGANASYVARHSSGILVTTVVVVVAIVLNGRFSIRSW